VTVYNGWVANPNPSTLPSGNVNQAYTGQSSQLEEWTNLHLDRQRLASLRPLVRDTFRWFERHHHDNNTLTITGTPTAALRAAVRSGQCLGVDSGGHSAGPIAYTITVYGRCRFRRPIRLRCGERLHQRRLHRIHQCTAAAAILMVGHGLPSDGLNVMVDHRKHAHHRRYADNACVRRQSSHGHFNVTLTDTSTNAQVTKTGTTSLSAIRPQCLCRNQPELAAIGNHHQSYGARSTRRVALAYAWSINGQPLHRALEPRERLTAYNTGGNTEHQRNAE